MLSSGSMNKGKNIHPDYDRARMNKYIFRKKIYDIDNNFLTTLCRIGPPIDLLKLCKKEECFTPNCQYFHSRAPDKTHELNRCAYEFLSRVLCYHYVMDGICPHDNVCRRVHLGGHNDDNTEMAALKLKLRCIHTALEIYSRKQRQRKYLD